MPDIDLDAELAEMRESARRSMPVPAFGLVRDRHKQRTVRRRMQIGAAVAVLVVSLAVPLLRAGLAPESRPPAAPPAPVPDEQQIPDGPFVLNPDFADAEHGYAIRGNCPGRKYVNCTGELLATDDGGRRWESREIPDLSFSKGQLPVPHVLGPQEIALDWTRPDPANNRVGRRAFSEDGGQTWRTVELPHVPTESVPAIPDGGELVRACAELVGGGQQCAARGFAVLMPGTGESALLANAPELEDVEASRAPTADGRWWLVGRAPETRDWTIAVSDDDGRTWVTSTLDWQGSALDWSIATHDGTLYASVTGSLPFGGEEPGLLAIFRSTDDGRSWEQTWHPDEDKAPRETWGQVVVANDGNLLINAVGGEGRTYLSSDGGSTFTEVERRFNGGAYWTRIGWMAFAAEVHHGHQFSPDGIDWRELKIG